MLRSISLSKRSFSFTQAYRRYILTQNVVRHNHSQVNSSSSAEISEGLILHDSYNPLWNATTPLQELVSLDDFGAVSVHKLLNDPSEKEMPLHKFLDQLLRPVPTTTEPIEMGGSIELNDAERDNLETALSEGYDVSAVIGLLEEKANDQDPILIVQPPKRKPDLGFTKVGTVAAAIAAATVSPNGHGQDVTLPVLPNNPSTSYQQQTAWDRHGEHLLDLSDSVLQAVDRQDMSALKNIVRSRNWPTAFDLGYRSKEVLSFVIANASSAKEALEHLTSFLKVNPKFYLQNDLLLQLVQRGVSESGVSVAIEILEIAKSLSLNSPNRQPNISLEHVSHLFTTILSRANFNDSRKLFEVLTKYRIIKVTTGSRLWAQAILQHRKQRSLTETVSSWMQMSVATKTTNGIELIWDEIVQNGVDSEIIGDILSHCKKTEHSSATIGELICGLVRNGKVDEARMVFSKVYLMGRYLQKPLKRLAAQGDVKSIELMAELVSSCLYEEKKVNGRKAKKESAGTKSELHYILDRKVDQFIGSHNREGGMRKREQKLKRHRINEEQLFELLQCVRKEWFKVAKDETSRDKIRSWCERNGVEQLKKSG